MRFHNYNYILCIVILRCTYKFFCFDQENDYDVSQKIFELLNFKNKLVKKFN